MTRYLRYLFLASLLLCSCEEEKPKEILSKEEMTDFLIEIYLSEARIGATPVNRDSGLKLFYPRQKQILEKRGIPDSTLRATYQYYLQHPDEMDAILGTVIDSLALREQRLFNAQMK